MLVTVKEGPDGGFDFAGPFVRGAKLRLVDVDPGLIEQAMLPGHTLVARIRAKAR